MKASLHLETLFDDTKTKEAALPIVDVVLPIVPDEDYITRKKNPETKFETLKFECFFLMMHLNCVLDQRNCPNIALRVGTSW